MNCFKMCRMKTLFFSLLIVLVAGSSYAVEIETKGTKIVIGGQVKLSMMYDIDGNVNDNIPNGMGDEVSATGIPLNGTDHADEERYSMTARESRLYIKTRTETDKGILSFYIEGDYNSDTDYSSDTWSNSRQLRLRHAVGSFRYGSSDLLAGQTWTNFMDFAGAVPVMDLAGDPGQPFVRQPQLRYTYNISPGHYFAISAENPDRGLTAGGTLFQNETDTTEHTELMPDFIAKYFWANKWFHLSPKVLVRRFEVENKSTTAYAVSLTSHVGFNGHKFYLGLTYGDGIGRYAGLGMNAGAGLSDAGDIETVEFQSINGGFTFKITDEISWTLGAGYSENDEDSYTDGVLSGSANKTCAAWHTMVAWKLSPSVEWAVGYTSMYREVMDGRKGDMKKAQSYIKFTL